MKVFKIRQRKRLKLDLQLIKPVAYGGKICKSDDLSEGGLFVESAEPLSIGEKVTIKFPINSSFDSMEVTGKVAWNRTENKKSNLGNKLPGMGICFDDIDEQKKTAIREILDLTANYGWFT